MELLSKDQIFWARFLAKEPTKAERKRRYLYHGLTYYLITAWHYRDRIAEVLAVIAIAAFFVELYYLDEIVAWLAGVRP